MDGDHGGLGVCGDGGRVHGGRLRKQRRASESGGDSGIRRARGVIWEVRSLYCSAASWRDCRCGAGLAALHSSLERDTGPGTEACMLLHSARDTECFSEFGPRVAHALLPIAGKGSSDWGYAPIPVIGPLLGGALAGWLLRFLVVA